MPPAECVGTEVLPPSGWDVGAKQIDSCHGAASQNGESSVAKSPLLPPPPPATPRLCVPLS